MAKMTQGTMEHLRWMQEIRGRGDRGAPPIRLLTPYHYENRRRHDALVRRGFIVNRGGYGG